MVIFYYSSNWKQITYIISVATWDERLSHTHTRAHACGLYGRSPLPDRGQTDHLPLRSSTPLPASGIHGTLNHDSCCLRFCRPRQRFLRATLGLIWSKRVVNRMGFGVAKGVLQSSAFQLCDLRQTSQPFWASFTRAIKCLNQASWKGLVWGPCEMIDIYQVLCTFPGTYWNGYFIGSNGYAMIPALINMVRVVLQGDRWDRQGDAHRKWHLQVWSVSSIQTLGVLWEKRQPCRSGQGGRRHQPPD